MRLLLTLTVLSTCTLPALGQEISFRFEDGYATALLFFSGEEESMAGKMYERMEYVNPKEEGIGLAKRWHEQLFQWKCTAFHAGNYGCRARFHSSHASTSFDLQSKSLTFEGGSEFAQAFVRDQGGFAMGLHLEHDLSIEVHKERFFLSVE